jgi:tRNA-guanine family transglycosylase
VNIGFDIFVLRMPIIWAEKGVAMTFNFDPDNDFEDLCMDLKDMEYAHDHTPVVNGCDCLCCRNHTRSYIHHLLEVHEILAGTLLVLHNIRHYQRFFEAIRGEIHAKYNK